MSENNKKTSSELAKDNLESLKSGIEDLKKIQKGSYFYTSSDAYSSNPSNEKKINKTPTDKECKKCKSSNSLNALYCKSCGEKLFEEKKIITRKCDKCGNEYDSSYVFCPKDGTEIVKEESIIQDIPKQKKIESIPQDESEQKEDNKIIYFVKSLSTAVLGVLMYSYLVVGVMDFEFSRIIAGSILLSSFTIYK